MTTAHWLVILLMLQACGMTPGLDPPLTMPPADGRAQAVKFGLQNFVVSRRGHGQVALRVTRIAGRDLDYSDGAQAKAVAEAYCATYNRALSSAAMGHYSLPNAWVFGGDCL